MPKIACPNCKKQYSLPDSAAGRVATCKACGKKFRISIGTSQSKASRQPTPKPKMQQKAVAAKETATVSTSASDSFWDEEFPVRKNEVEQASPSPVGAGQRTSTSPATGTHSSPKSNKKKKKKRKVSWGADWGKVAGGLITFVIFGGLALMSYMGSGRIRIWTAIVAIGGLFTALSGLMGEDGVW